MLIHFFLIAFACGELISITIIYELVHVQRANVQEYMQLLNQGKGTVTFTFQKDPYK